MSLLIRISFIAACVALVVFDLHMINTYFVNVPILDNWSFLELYEKVHNNTATFWDFTHRHNEHRIVTLRLIFAPLALLTGWDLTYEAYAIIIALVIMFIALIKITFYQQSNYQSNTLTILAPLSALVTGAFLFSNIQYGSVLFPINLLWYIIISSASIGIFLFVWPNERLRLLRFSLAAAVCLVATYSAASGMSVWLALLPSVFVFARKSKYKIHWIASWLILFAVSSAVYLIGYENPGGHPNVMAALYDPLSAIRYFLILLGRPLAPWGTIPPMLVIGGILTAAYLYFTIAYIRHFGTRLSDQYAPWLSLGLVALFYAFLVTIGRMGAGEESAITSDRYMATTMLLAISLTHLIRLFVCERRTSSQATAQRHKPAYAIIFVYGILLAHLIDDSVATNKRIEAWSVKTKQYEQCLELLHYAPRSCLREIFPAWRIIKERSLIIERLNFRQFAKNLAFVDPGPEGLHHGHINLGELLTAPISLNKANQFELTGWVVRPSMLKPFMVLFSYGEEHPKFFTSTRVGTKISARVGTEIIPNLTASKWGYSPWSVKIHEKNLPDGKHIIRAWIYDREGQRFVKLSGEIPIIVSN
ncbi:MAG: hypothetical protein GXP09_13240 [Gammaproteobacteria bacterium]|nr:hypothetical protein [Gammaproteobacteria bacterium]